MTSPVDDSAPANEATQPVPAVLSSLPTAAMLLKALRRHWLLAAVLGTLCAGTAAVAAWVVVPTRYTARALLDVACTPPKVVFSTNENRVDPFHTYQRKQLALVKSRLVLTAALRRPKVAELSIVRQQVDPVDWLEDQVQADYSVAPEILRVSITGKQPEELAI